MQLVYNGPHPEVVVDELDQDTVITAGQPVEIPDDLAARLIEQDTWAVAGETPEQRAAREAKAAADKARAEADAQRAARELAAAQQEADDPSSGSSN